MCCIFLSGAFNSISNEFSFSNNCTICCSEMPLNEIYFRINRLSPEIKILLIDIFY